MKKIITTFFMVSAAIMILNTQSVFSFENGWTGGCRNCHNAGQLHPLHPGQACTSCHANPSGGTPDIKNCAGCHEGDCGIINNSIPPHPSSCLSCHSGCAPVTTTTTTSVRPNTTTTSVQSTTTTTTITCSYSISPTSKTFRASGGKGAVRVSTANGCDWEATSTYSWITITSGAIGSGSGRVSYTVATNPDTTERTGSMDIAGETFTVLQAGRRR